MGSSYVKEVCNYCEFRHYNTINHMYVNPISHTHDDRNKLACLLNRSKDINESTLTGKPTMFHVLLVLCAVILLAMIALSMFPQPALTEAVAIGTTDFTLRMIRIALLVAGGICGISISILYARMQYSNDIYTAVDALHQSTKSHIIASLVDATYDKLGEILEQASEYADHKTAIAPKVVAIAEQFITLDRYPQIQTERLRQRIEDLYKLVLQGRLMYRKIHNDNARIISARKFCEFHTELIALRNMVFSTGRHVRV